MLSTLAFDCSIAPVILQVKLAMLLDFQTFYHPEILVKKDILEQGRETTVARVRIAQFIGFDEISRPKE